MMSHWITNHGLTGENPVRMGTGNSILFPLRVFETKTKPMYIAGTNDTFWKILCKALGCEEWLAASRFATNEGRVAHRAILEPMMEMHFAEHTCEELLETLLPAGMPCSSVQVVSDLMDNAHVKARGAIVEYDYPGLGPIKTASNPIKLSDAPFEVRRLAPRVGEHTIEIMRDVGYSDAEIAALRDAKAVGAP